MRTTVLAVILTGALVAQAQIPQGPHHAVVIGLRHYRDPRLASLTHSENDARDVGRWLAGQGWQVTEVLPGERHQPTTAATILAIVRATARACPPTGSLLVYFSGHGGELAGRSQVFAYETMLDGPEPTGLLVADLLQALQDGGRARSTLIIDACRNPVRSKGGGGPLGGARWDDLTVAAGHFQYFGTSAGQTADEPASDLTLPGGPVRNGFFTHLLLAGLKEPGVDRDADGFLGLLELHLWLQPQMKALRDRGITSQVPDLHFGGSGDLVLGRAPADRVPPTLSVTGPLVAVDEGYVRVEGQVEDVSGVDRVTVVLPGGREERAALDANRWFVNLRLGPGFHRVSVQAFDRFQNVTAPLRHPITVRAANRRAPIEPTGAPSPAIPRPAAGPARFAGLTDLGRRNAAGCELFAADADPSVILILVPGGTFTMGSDDRAATAMERRLTEVTLSPFFISQHEITWDQFDRYAQATGSSKPLRPAWKPGGSHPVVHVSWTDAQAYAQWAGLALPTEPQWEFAARGTDGRLYPWGATLPSADPRLANGEGTSAGFRETTPVGTFSAGAGPFGTLDQAGNVAEWCADGSRGYPGGKLRNPAPATGRGSMVVRGGGWFSGDRDLRATRRDAGAPADRLPYVGFRVAGSAAP